MRIGASIFLIAVGAILAFAVHVHTTGFDVTTVGAILMVVGAVGLVLTLSLWNRRQRTVIRRGPMGEVVEERHVYDYDEPPQI